MTAQLAGLNGARCDGNRVLAFDDGQGCDLGLLAELSELLLRGGPARIERGHQDLFLVAVG